MFSECLFCFFVNNLALIECFNVRWCCGKVAKKRFQCVKASYSSGVSR